MVEMNVYPQVKCFLLWAGGCSWLLFCWCVMLKVKMHKQVRQCRSELAVLWSRCWNGESLLLTHSLLAPRHLNSLFSSGLILPFRFWGVWIVVKKMSILGVNFPFAFLESGDIRDSSCLSGELNVVSCKFFMVCAFSLLFPASEGEFWERLFGRLLDGI